MHSLALRTIHHPPLPLLPLPLLPLPLHPLSLRLAITNLLCCTAIQARN